MWLFRECGAPYLFLHALLHPSIKWRSLEFRLQWGGRAEAVPNKIPSKVVEEGKEKQMATIQLSSPDLPPPYHLTSASSHLLS